MMETSSGPGNMAGFGARRFQTTIENKRLEQERVQWEQQQYERHRYEQLRYEQQQYEQQQYEEQQYEQQQAYEREQYEQQQQYDLLQYEQMQQYEEQQRFEQQMSARYQYDQYHLSQQQNHSSQQIRHPQARQNRPSASGAYDDESGAYDNYAQDQSVLRSRTMDTVATSSTAALAYDRDVGLPRSASINSAYGGCYENDDSSQSSTIDAPISRRERQTMYEDDFEESDHFDRGVESYVSPSQPYNRVARATVLQPDLPKAKCADCGEELGFEDLADHTCLARSISAAASPLVIQITPIPGDNASTFGGLLSPATLQTPRSPFFDKYQDVLGDGGSSSPAFSMPSTPAELYDSEPSWTLKSSTQDETPKASAVRLVGPPKVGITGSLTYDSLSVAQVDRPSVQRSKSDSSGDAEARRKMIEEQRANKKKGLLTPVLPAVASIPAPSSPHTHGHFKTESYSSVSTTASSLLENSAFQRHPASDVSNITPSTSYDRFEDASPAKPGHKARTQSRGRSEIDLSNIEEMMKGLITSPPKTSHSGRGKSAPTSPRPEDDRRTDRERVLEKELDRLRERERTRQLQMLRAKEKKRKEREGKRCCVCDCSLSSSRTPFVERDGKLLCARDWKELYLPKCRKCNLAVEKGAVKSSDGALRGVFHRDCFACAACNAPFNDKSFYVYNGQPYCSRHYHRLNGSLCRECETGIEGDCRQTDSGERFHPECFRCQWTSKNGPCSQALSTYHSVGGQRLCQRHADKVSLKLARSGQPHDISSRKRNTMLHHLS